MMTQSQIVTDGQKQELIFLGTEVYRTPSHKYTKMTIPKTKVTIFIMHPNNIMTGCKVLKVPFQTAYQTGGSWVSQNDLGSIHHYYGPCYLLVLASHL